MTALEDVFRKDGFQRGHGIDAQPQSKNFLTEEMFRRNIFLFSSK
jgi:hypothetical protein